MTAADPADDPDPAGGRRPDVDRVDVVVPVHDEEELLPRCLAALAVAAARATGVRVGVTVVLDACTDSSAEVARAAGVRTVTVAVRNVGRARAAGFAVAATVGPGAASWPATTWLATTDGDSVVPPDWLTGQLAHARAGAGVDLVLGTVTVDDWSGWPAETAGAHEERYGRPGPGRGHPHVHGANLGVRADLYRALGGFAPLPTGEDHALVTAAVAAGARVRRVLDLPVVTSGRSTGRAPDGFSGHLRQLAGRHG